MLTSGVLDKSRLFSNFLLLVLLAGNIYLSVQFIENMKKPVLVEDQNNAAIHVRSTRFLKNFIDKVLGNQGTVSFEDRVQLENDILQMHDPVLTTSWNDFVGSKTAKVAQKNAVKLMALLIDRV